MPEARIRSFFAGKLAVAAIFALALGLILGVFARNTQSPALLGFALVAKPFGLLWTNALRMVVLPLMISYLVLAINAVARGIPILDLLPILPGHWPLVVYEKTKNQFEIVREIINSQRISHIVCATDAGREGELIFRYIYEAAESRKPVQRLWISSLTPEAIRAGFSG